MGMLIRLGVILSVVFLAIFGLGVALGVLQGQGIEAWMAGVVESEGGRWWLGLGVVGVLAGDVVLGVPATVVMVAAGAWLGPVWGGVCSAIGVMLAGLIGYGGSRWMGREWFMRRVGAEEVERVRVVLERYGVLGMVVARGLPILPEVVSCVAGVSGVGIWRFVLVYGGVSVPWAILHAVAGANDPWLSVGLVVGLPGLAWVMWRAILRKAKRLGQ